MAKWQIGQWVYYATQDDPPGTATEGDGKIIAIRPSKTDPSRLEYDIELSRLRSEEAPEIVTMAEDDVISLYDEDEPL